MSVEYFIRVVLNYNVAKETLDYHDTTSKGNSIQANSPEKKMRRWIGSDHALGYVIFSSLFKYLSFFAGLQENYLIC